MTDCFISYNTHDRPWAEWIAWQLEERGFCVTIQAWDFVGNWVLKMDQAMRDTQRTVAVLSPHYVKALVAQPEWANAFRLDPTGEKDLLIPVRVAPVELDGILAQIGYVDFVGRNEDEARNLLLKRVRRERGKPDTSPKFPTDRPSRELLSQRSIVQKPVYPAAAEDEEKLRQVRDIVIRWRGQYTNKIDSLRIASERARTWSRELPTHFSDDVAQVITLVAAAARDFQALPLYKLEFAKAYGLIIHETVFWGNAIDDVLHTNSCFGPETQAAHKEVREAKKRLGVPTYDLPNKYGFEMLARILEAALALAQFNINTLPRGYLKKPSGEVVDDLRQYRGLVIASKEDDPGLHLIAVDGALQELGSFVARNLDLYPLCAQVNQEGSLDLVAHDNQHLYCWRTSSQLPTMQFPRNDLILNARFLSARPGAKVTMIGMEGAVTVITTDDGCKTSCQGRKGRWLIGAEIWVDPLDKDAWYVVSLAEDYVVSSKLHGLHSSNEAGEELWNDPVFQIESADGLHWNALGGRHTTLTTLDGLPCLIIIRPAYWGFGVCFLDPRTLLSIRQPLVIREFVSDMTIAAGRWLVVTLLKNDDPPQQPILVWDLDSNDKEPIGGGFEERGDVYTPIVIAETKESFQTVQVFRTLNLPPSENFCELFRFDWPSGAVEILKRFRRVRIMPVVGVLHS